MVIFMGGKLQQNNANSFESIERTRVIWKQSTHPATHPIHFITRKQKLQIIITREQYGQELWTARDNHNYIMLILLLLTPTHHILFDTRNIIDWSPPTILHPLPTSSVDRNLIRGGAKYCSCLHWCRRTNKPSICLLTINRERLMRSRFCSRRRRTNL